MIAEVITDELAEKIKCDLMEAYGIENENITYEIQDNFRFILFSINIRSASAFMKNNVFYREVVKLLDKIVPTRKGDYSWMVNFIKDGEIIDSYFGGDSDFPDSALW